eukprot:948208-Prorocentrum_minimum.AAC.1
MESHRKGFPLILALGMTTVALVFMITGESWRPQWGGRERCLARHGGSVFCVSSRSATWTGMSAVPPARVPRLDCADATE